MRRVVTLLLLLSQLLGATMIKVATYNVENLFDLEKSGHEYKEYIPYSKSQWNKKNYTIKLRNIARVIKDINADIIALQEIESLQALKDLRFTLKRQGLYYPYFKIANYKKTTVKVAILSKIPFVYTHEIAVQSSYRYRNILEAKFRVDGEDFFVLVNHWKAKSGAESMRVVSAKKLLKRCNELGDNQNIIVLGDFNSHYEENITFKRKRKLNDTGGITGINDILATKYYKRVAAQTELEKDAFYNLWYDTPESQRYSYIYRRKKEALDSILISKSLLDKRGMEYKKGSISNFHPPYVFKGKGIYRWQVSRKRVKVHRGKGYSDHLAVSAVFLTN